MCNTQSCIRLNDIESMGDGTHLGYFNMLGTFSFRHWTLLKTIEFWRGFMDRLGIVPTHVTVHPDKQEWQQFHTLPVKLDSGCVWTDGDIYGYCTEFYVGDVEIGNIVNPLGTCIDVGFGLERLDCLINGVPVKSIEHFLIDVISKIVDSGVRPSNSKRGYVLRRLLRTLYKRGGSFDHPVFKQEVERQIKVMKTYERLKGRHFDKSKQWWLETHGVDLV